jgi:hypothetical protein
MKMKCVVDGDAPGERVTVRRAAIGALRANHVFRSRAECRHKLFLYLAADHGVDEPAPI